MMATCTACGESNRLCYYMELTGGGTTWCENVLFGRARASNGQSSSPIRIGGGASSGMGL